MPSCQRQFVAETCYMLPPSCCELALPLPQQVSPLAGRPWQWPSPTNPTLLDPSPQRRDLQRWPASLASVHPQPQLCYSRPQRGHTTAPTVRERRRQPGWSRGFWRLSRPPWQGSTQPCLRRHLPPLRLRSELCPTPILEQLPPSGVPAIFLQSLSWSPPANLE